MGSHHSFLRLPEHVLLRSSSIIVCLSLIEKSAAMGYIDSLATVYPPHFYQRALLGVIGISGLVKVIPAVQRWLDGWFPFLPTWTWTRVAVWELAFVAVYLLLGWKVFAINMCFMLIGGALWVTNFQSKRIQSSSSLLRKTFGLALIPVRRPCSVAISQLRTVSPRIVSISMSMDNYSRSVSVY